MNWIQRMIGESARSLSCFALLHLTIRTASFIEQWTGELCDTEVFRAECQDNEVILMTKVSYGRMRLGRCVEMELGYVGCHRDLLLMADQRCSGKRVCEIRIPDAQFENTRPCLKELKNYMEASYACIGVESVSSEFCRRNNELIITSRTLHGFIANIVTTDTPSCDGTTHPWVIRVSTGQLINLTLYDFALAGALHTPTQQRKHHPPPPHHRIHLSQQQHERHPPSSSQELLHLTICRQYGLLQDGETEKPSSICGATERRISHLYLSTSNVVKVWLTAGSAPRDLKRFVIEFTVIGCPEFPLPLHSWFERTTGGDGILGCDQSDDRWPLRCVNNTWIGSYGNCSHATQPEMNESIATGNQDRRSATDDVTIVIIIITVSTAIVVLLLVAGIVRCVRN